ncbi:Chitinase 3 [Cladobotryum mycophilum]|uniref:Chitinase 3 n=1 Tax=Cladobotryum mycophilum TaxID=491253 RepID=A0ABR0SI58_9HYPO
MRATTKISLAVSSLALTSKALDLNRNTNLISYYGQFEGASGDVGNLTLRKYCDDSIEDVIALAFLSDFPNFELSLMVDCPVFPNTKLQHCPELGKDIKYCQSKGKSIFLSMGGPGVDVPYGFKSEDEGQETADKMWDMFFSGKNKDAPRPFDDAILDGISIDILSANYDVTGYKPFIDTLRSHFASDKSKTYYIAGGAEGSLPENHVGQLLAGSTWFDLIWIFCYNTYACHLDETPDRFTTTYFKWVKLAQEASINKHLKFFIGAAGSPEAAQVGYANADQIKEKFDIARSNITDLGGIMLYDTYASRASGLGAQVKKVLDTVN